MYHLPVPVPLRPTTLRSLHLQSLYFSLPTSMIVDDAHVFDLLSAITSERGPVAASQRPYTASAARAPASHRADRPTDLVHIRAKPKALSPSLLAAASSAQMDAGNTDRRHLLSGGGLGADDLGFYAARGPQLSVAARAQLQRSLARDAPDAVLARLRATARLSGHTGISAWKVHHDHEQRKGTSATYVSQWR